MKRLKRGFTLIELLAVIIILAVVALIATPLILNVIEDSRKSAGLSQAYLILDGAEQFYTNTLINPNNGIDSLNGAANVYELISFTGDKPENVKVLIKKDGDVALSYFHEGYCYNKEFTDNEITQIEAADETCSEVKEESSEIVFSSDGLLGDTEFWAFKEYDVTVNAEGMSWKYCLSGTTCIPDTVGSGSTLTLTEENDTACVTMIDGEQPIKTMCKQVYFDSFQPVITQKEENFEMHKGLSFHPSFFFDVEFGSSNGSVKCDIKETSRLELGNQSINCSAVSNAGAVTTTTLDLVVTDPTLDPTDLSCFSGGNGTISITSSCTEENVVVPEVYNGVNVTTFNFAYPQNNNVKTVVLPDTTTSLSGTYYYTPNLEAVALNEGLQVISERRFEGSKLTSIVIPSTITDINARAFYQSDLRFVELNGILNPDYSIYNSLYKYYSDSEIFANSSIEEVVLVEGLNLIPREAFENNKIKEIQFPDSLTTIDQSAFNLNLLVDLVIPSTINFLNRNIFVYNKLENVYVEDGSSINEYGFSVFNYNPTLINTTVGPNLNCKDKDCGNFTTENLYLQGIVGEEMFDLWGSKIKHIVIPEGVTILKEYTDTAGCLADLGLESVILPQSLEIIDEYSLRNNNIKNLVIPDSVHTIGAGAFSYNGTQTIDTLILGKNVQTIGVQAFQNVTIKYLYVPETVTATSFGFYLNVYPDTVCAERDFGNVFGDAVHLCEWE